MTKRDLKAGIIAGDFNGVTAGIMGLSYHDGITLLFWDDEIAAGYYSYQTGGGYDPEINKNSYTDNMRLFSVEMQYTRAGDPYFNYNGTRYSLDNFMRQTIDAGEYEDQHVKRRVIIR